MKMVALTLALTANVASGDGLSVDAINKEIATGTSAKDVRAIKLSKGRAECYATTPELRVRLAAFDAKKEYKTFAAAQVSEDMSAPTVEVVCNPIRFLKEHGDIVGVRTIVIVPKGGAPIQPAHIEPLPERYQTAFGATFDREGMLAVFPVEAFKVGSEVRVVYAEKIAFSNFAKPSDDVGMEIRTTE